MYRFKNSLIAMCGLAAIAVVVPMLLPFVGLSVNTVSGNAPTAQTQNVNVVNTPTVTAQQSGTWNVGINGTPTVNVSFPQTVLAYDETRTVGLPNNISYVFPQFDSSRFKEIRVVINSTGDASFTLNPRFLNPNNNNEVVVLDDINVLHSGEATALYELPGQTMDFYAFSGPQATIHVQVYGRSN